MKPDFIPDKFVAGKFKNYAFLTCKYKREKWVGESIFTRLTGGFKPHSQRDSVKELKKAITDNTPEIDNVPVSGFKLKNIVYSRYDENIYSLDEFRGIQVAIVEDPRGFDVLIPVSEFFELVSMNGGNLNNFMLENLECVYAWSPYNSRPCLFPVKDPTYQKVMDDSKAILNYKDNTKYITSKQLKVGQAYKGSDIFPGIYVYLGKMNVYSNCCHEIAISEQSYDVLDVLSKRTTDISGKDRYIFYQVGAVGGQNSPAPFIAKTSISKLFESETSYDPSKYSMFDSDLSCTIDNIKAAAEESPFLNEIDFKASFKNAKKMSYEQFDKFLIDDGYGKSSLQTKNEIWPFPYYHREDKCLSGVYNCLIKICYDYSRVACKLKQVCRIDRNRDQRYYYSEEPCQIILENVNNSAESLFNAINPMTNVIYYKSGKQMPQKYALFFFAPDYSHGRSYFSIYS